MEETGPSHASPPPLTETPPAWWSWPVILFSVLFIGGTVFLESSGRPDAEDSAEPSLSAVSSADLALLKLEGQVIIAAAAAAADGKEAERSLEEIRSQVRGDGMTAGYLLLRDFVLEEGARGEPGEPISWRAEQSRVRTLTEKAIASGIDPRQRAELAEMLGWFAKLARDSETGEVTERSAVQLRAMLVLSLVGILLLGGIFGVILGTVFLFLHLKRQREKGGQLAFSAAGRPRAVLLECFAIYLGTMAVGDLAIRDLPVGFSPAVYALAILLPLVWPLIRKVSWREFVRSIGWHRGKGILREISAGVVGYAGVLAIAAVGIFLTLVLAFVVTQIGAAGGEAGSGKGGPAVGPVTHPIVGWIYEGGWKERLLCLLLAAGFAPLFEELFFRGALHRYLRGGLGFLPAALVTGLIFAALHPQGWMGIPALAAIGVGFSLLREWRDSLIAPMVAHAINNGVLVGLFCFAL